MIIIDNTIPPSPRYVYEPIPIFKNEYEFKLWCEVEMDRYINGYNGLSGKHYYYLRQIHLKVSGGEKTIRPRWRDCDEWVLDEVNICEAMGWDWGGIKGRGFGLSSIFIGMMPLYYSVVTPGANSTVTSKTKNSIFNIYREKLVFAYNKIPDKIQGFDNPFKPFAKNMSNTEQNMFMALESKVQVEGTSTKEVKQTLITCVETSQSEDSVTNMSSGRSKYIFVDELPLHPRPSQLHSSASECLIEEGEKVGFMVWGGTVEEKALPATIDYIRQINAYPEVYKTKIQFIPFWWGDKYSINGHSNEKASTEAWEKQCEMFEKAGAKDKLSAYKKNRPKTLDEALQLMSVGGLPVDIVELLNIQEKAIWSKELPISFYTLERTEDDGVIAIPDIKNGWVKILEHPQEASKKDYLGACDPIPFADNSIVEGSANAVGIKERVKETYVALMVERLVDASLCVERMMLLQDYYYNCPMSGESNAGGVIMNKYKDLGRYKDLADRPLHLGIKWTDSSAKKWVHKNDKIQARMNDCLFEHLRKHSGNIWFIEIIEQLKKFPIENTDIVSMMQVMELYDKNIENKTKKNLPAEPIKRKRLITYTDANGKRLQAWM